MDLRPEIFTQGGDPTPRRVDAAADFESEPRDLGQIPREPNLDNLRQSNLSKHCN
jgi:hypothetical protein